MRAEILSVGTELLLGHITDTNATYLAQQLSALGIDLFYVSQVGDNLGRLTDTMRRAWGRSDLIITTGGVGPTEDDLTREAICELLGETMVVQPDLERDLRAHFSRRGSPMPERNIKQATLIPSAQALPNPVGTAPGWWVEREGRIIVSMPGVPREMFRMWENEAVPRLQKHLGAAVIVSRTVKVLGLAESAVEEMLGELLASTNPTIATYAKDDGIHVRLTSKAGSTAEANAAIAGMEQKVRAILGDAIFGVDADTLASVIDAMMGRRGLSLAVADGLTGGMFLTMLYGVTPPSYLKGALALCDPEGLAVLETAEEAPRCDDLVTGPSAELMAEAVAHRFGASVGLAITGVAERVERQGVKPGTAFVSIWRDGQVETTERGWPIDPAGVRLRAAREAITALRASLLALE
jgi:nicotinamide-nucleotide amidase